MGFFDKFFGSKSEGEMAAGAGGADIVAAVTLHLEGEHDGALEAYGKIMADFPDERLAPFLAAVIQAGRGECAEAADGLRSLSKRIADGGDVISRAIALELVTLVQEELIPRGIPAVAERIVAAGDALKGEGFVRESVVCFEIGAALLPEHASVLHKLGDTLHDLRQFEYAESVLQEALTQAPNHWGALYTYAVLLQDLGRNEEAIDRYERAVALNPSHANCRNNYGAALLRVNRIEEALEQCSRAAELAPDSPFVKVNLGNIHLIRNEYEEARACFGGAIALNGAMALAYYGLGSVEMATGGDHGRIRELYERALDLSPGIPEIYQSLGNLLAADGDPDSLHFLSRAFQMNSKLKDIHRDLGAAFLKTGHREEALEHLRIALQRNPDDSLAKELLTATEGA